MYIDKANVKEQPDWTREQPRRFWDPSWNLLKSIKKQLSTSVILTLIAFLLSFLTFAAHAALPKTSEGWTIFTPSKDSLIVYVSNDGDDETAKKYTKKQLGNSPFTPPENMVLRSFKTFKAVFEKTRKNKPDWILVKRGDNFFESIDVRNGKSLTEPFLIATYGEDYANPIFNTGAEKALNKYCHSLSDIAIKNNLYVDGEIGISAGANKAGAYRFKNYQITDNVMLIIGRSQPTGRTLGWGLEIKDWDSGIVKNNYFLNQVNSQVTNTYGVKISGTTKNVEIENNKFDNLFSANAIVLGAGGSKENIAINNNQFTFKENGEALIRVEKDLAGYSLKTINISMKRVFKKHTLITQQVSLFGKQFFHVLRILIL